MSMSTEAFEIVCPTRNQIQYNSELRRVSNENCSSFPVLFIKMIALQ